VNETGVTQRWFVYGNYIDEPLMMYAKCLDSIDAGGELKRRYYYIHDALYNVRALVSTYGIEEESTYDVYGRPITWATGDFDADSYLTTTDIFAFSNAYNTSQCDPNYNWRCDTNYDGYVTFSDVAPLQRLWSKGSIPGQHSRFTNPYYFTSRRLDVLDDGSLKIQYNRNRYYDNYTGRWLTHDPLGIVPNAQIPNVHYPMIQYSDGLNLYEYVKFDPVSALDPTGLIDIDLFEVGLWVGIGGSASGNYKTDHKDCCACNKIIKDGFRKYTVTVEGSVGIGAGGKLNVKGVGLDLAWKGPSIIGKKTCTIKNSKCGGPIDTGKYCKEYGVNMAPGEFSVGALGIGLSGELKGDFEVRFCVVSEVARIYGTLEGRFNVNMYYTTRILGIKVERFSGHIQEDQPWTVMKKVKILNVPKTMTDCAEVGIACPI
jgi:RHS repeat-associated protein